MEFEPSLKKGILIRRYKRFLADIKLHTNKILTIYCPNTGAMLSCSTSGATVWYSCSLNTQRKYFATWELYHDKHFVVVNTHRANDLISEAITLKKITTLEGLVKIDREVKLNQQSRIDFMLTTKNKKTYIEVKSVTYCSDAVGYFPDAISKRGQKHLKELIALKKAGHRAILLFCVMHEAIACVKPAKHIDFEYSQLCYTAYQAGVEFLAYKALINQYEVVINDQVPVYF